MKKITSLFVFFLMMLQLLAQQKTITIHGVIKDKTIKSIEITHLTDAQLSKWENKKLDIVNGEFKGSLQIPFPTKIVIAYGNRFFDKTYVDGDAEIMIDTVGRMQIIGSQIQNENESEFLPFFKSNDNLYDSLMSFYEKYGSNFPKGIDDSVHLLREKYGLQRADLLGDYIKSHPNSYIALWEIKYFASIPASYKYFNFEKLFSSFSPQMQQGSFISFLRDEIAQSNKMQAGQILPKDFFKGYEQTQNKIKNNCQYYLINFWYSHCGPCIAGFPRLKEIYDQFIGKGFDIVSISIDQQKDEKDYRAMIKKNGLLWNHVWDKDGAVAKRFNINAYPTYILLDKNDRIINYEIKSNQLEAFLKEDL